MEKCQICGKYSISTSSYADRENGVIGSQNAGKAMVICDFCLLQHVSHHYPGGAIQHAIMDHHYLTLMESAIHYPPISIAQRLAEYFVISMHAVTADKMNWWLCRENQKVSMTHRRFVEQGGLT